MKDKPSYMYTDYSNELGIGVNWWHMWDLKNKPSYIHYSKELGIGVNWWKLVGI